jgi:hypothetical protein
VDSLNTPAKSFTGYIPINYLTNKYQIDLSWCVEFYDYPQKLKKAYFEKPDKLDQKDRLFSQNIFNNDQMLIEYFYIDSLIRGTKTETLKLEYFSGTKNVKKITDSKDGSNYYFEYDKNGNIRSIGYFTVDNKMITLLRITE